ncbi:MAG: O-antigen ligase family protein [Acidobacteriota bacterium]
MSASATGQVRIGAGAVSTGTTRHFWSSSSLGVAALALHFPLGLALAKYPRFGVFHAGAALAVGLLWAFAGRHPWRVAYAAAYIAGAEVLWRMTGAPIFWEYSKYAVGLLFLIGRFRFGGGKAPAVPLIYFLLLLPSTVLTLSDPWPIAFNNLSFNLSGPFALMSSILFFWRLRISKAQYRRLLLVVVAPICGVSALTFQGLRQSGPIIRFGTQSNYASSGGFAPNQVSAVLGLGFAFMALYLVTAPSRPVLRLALMGMMMAFAAQSAMTFSRGGLYLAVGSLLAASAYLWREPGPRRRFLVGAVFVAVSAVLVVLPRLLAFTEGAILTRFAETSTTGRYEIVQADLLTWLEHPIAGVGPGRAASGRARFFREVASHTEFTRLLAEHGLFGLAAIVCLTILIRRALRRRGGTTARGLRGAMITWSTLFMLVDGMRLAAPAFVFGLSFVEILHRRSRLSRHIAGRDDQAQAESLARMQSPAVAAGSPRWVLAEGSDGQRGR